MTTSIITSMYNSKGKTIETIDKLFFPSILNNASSDKELVLLDDCSPLREETEAMVARYMPDLKKQFGNVIFQKNPENLGFGGSYNKGMRISGGDRLVVVNDDVYFPQDSVDSLVDTLSENTDYGLVGPITCEKGSFTYQYCKQAPKLNNYSAEELERIEEFARTAKKLMNKRRIKTDLITGFCFAVSSQTIKDMGVFDDSFKYGMWEDTDFARRIGQKYQIIINPEVYIHHGGVDGASGSLLQHPLKALRAGLENQYKYGKKWNDHLGAAKHFFRGLERMTGKNTVSELFDKKGWK